MRLDERLRRRRQLAAALRVFAGAGFSEGIAGHATARDPVEPDTFWVNPALQHFSEVTVGSLLRVDQRGEVVEGQGRVNPAAVALHLAIHRARPDAVAAVHMHSVYGRALAGTDQILEPLNQDACAFYGDHSIYDDYQGVVLDQDEAARIAAALGPAKAMILRNHGLLTVGGSVASAAWWFLSMERCCQVQLAIAATGGGRPIPHRVAQQTHAQVGTEKVGALSFVPIYARIVGAQPSLLDETPVATAWSAREAYR
ncbi:MAG TPA: class II aldolase/adducin family protein [Jatrophihabitans sp.]|nr:class II aldolase/adducin family protein [Jatrophihabitans sp.]